MWIRWTLAEEAHVPVPASDSLYWKVSYAAIVAATCINVLLIAVVQPGHTVVWLGSLVLLGLIGLGVLRMAQIKLSGGGWPPLTAEERATYWTTQRMFAAGGGLAAMLLLAVVIAFTMPSVAGALAFALMIAVFGWMVYVMRYRP
jgi:hypothetical protein